MIAPILVSLKVSAGSRLRAELPFSIRPFSIRGRQEDYAFSPTVVLVEPKGKQSLLPSIFMPEK